MEIGSSSSSADDLKKKNALATEFAERLRLTKQEKLDRRKVEDQLLSILKQDWPNCELIEYGSMVSGLALRDSDIDVSFFPAGLISGDIDVSCLPAGSIYLRKGDFVWIMNKYEGREGKLVKRIGKLLSKKGVNNEVISGARVPIVKFKDPEHNVHVDISVNKFNGYLNSQYLYDFQSLDPRVSQLILIVKQWAKARRINSSHEGTLSSYSYCLMCINFLQTRKPPILPVLQLECMAKTFALIEKDKVEGYYNNMNTFEYLPQKNEESLSELLGEFFHYWADVYDYEKDIISVRTGSILSRAEKNWSPPVVGIAIEDPFHTECNLSSSVCRGSLKTMKDEFCRAKSIMSEGQLEAQHEEDEPGLEAQHEEDETGQLEKLLE